MKKQLIFLLVSALAFGAVFGQALAQEEWKEEAILDFQSFVNVNQDNSISVTEIIKYDSGSWDRHGIYRDIYPYSAERRKVDIQDITVQDPEDNPYQFEILNEGKNLRIKIGSPDETFTGEKIYVVKYRASRAISQYEKFDEIYWNVTGDEWKMPIYKASAIIILPEGAAATQAACYSGPRGSSNQCETPDLSEGPYAFRAPDTLYLGEELTVAVGFPKGFTAPYSQKDGLLNFWALYGVWILACIPALITFIACFMHWRKNGRDPKGRGVIVPQYEILDGLTPMETAGILNQKVKAKDISAEIIYLATKGYLKLNQIEDYTLGVFKTTDYELLKTKNIELAENAFDKKLLSSIFRDGQDMAILSDLKKDFYKDVSTITDLPMKVLLTKGYYRTLGGIKDRKFWLILVLAWGIPYLWGRLTSVEGWWFPFSIFGAVLVYEIFFLLSPAKTPKGVEAREYILGLKDYLSIAEKDRLLFHNAPEKKPEVFEKLLPYAMVLGVADIWAREFKDIYLAPPEWYSGGSNGAFNAVVFNNSLKNFSSASVAAASAPSGSGSGGGGFSGGGGGGGGGGSW